MKKTRKTLVARFAKKHLKRKRAVGASDGCSGKCNGKCGSDLMRKRK